MSDWDWNDLRARPRVIAGKIERATFGEGGIGIRPRLVVEITSGPDTGGIIEVLPDHAHPAEAQAIEMVSEWIAKRLARLQEIAAEWIKPEPKSNRRQTAAR